MKGNPPSSSYRNPIVKSPTPKPKTTLTPKPSVTTVVLKGADWFVCPWGSSFDPSPAEQLIMDELSEYNIEWKREVSFNSFRLPTGGYARFDFYLPAFNILIEYNSREFHSTDDRIIVDDLKRQFCKDNDIRLIIWTHKDFYYLSDRISKLMTSLSIVNLRPIS